jgi:hypothetical protein
MIPSKQCTICIRCVQKHKTESTVISRSLTQNKKELETLILTSKTDLSTRVAENSRKCVAPCLHVHAPLVPVT